MIIFLMLFIIYSSLLSNCQQSKCHHVRPRQTNLKWWGYPNCTFEHICGGSILRPDVILTAHHCLVNEDLENIYVRPNYDNENFDLLDANGDLDMTKYYRISSFTAPIEGDIDINDIALAKLVRPITYTDRIRETNLPTQQYQRGTSLSAMGFGLMEDYTYPNHLMHVKLAIRSDWICNNFFHSIYYPSINLCSSGCGFEGPCVGDSGGPLIFPVGNQEVVVGVVSAGRDCEYDDPSIEMNVFHYVDWIQENLRILRGRRSLAINNNSDFTKTEPFLVNDTILTSKVFGGEEMTTIPKYIVTFWTYQYPNDLKTLTMFCTGVIYKADIVISTKFCNRISNISAIFIRPNLDNCRRPLPREDHHTVELVICHGEFPAINMNVVPHEICLFKLIEPFQDNEYESIHLPPAPYQPSALVWAQGFGLYQPSDQVQQVSYTLRETELYIRTLLFCYFTLDSFQNLTNLCAQGCELQSGCPGDEGSPLIEKTESHFILHGLLLDTGPCGADTPTLYVNIFTCRNWINNRSEHLSALK